MTSQQKTSLIHVPEPEKKAVLFGTDGIRGRADQYPLDDDTVTRIISSFVHVMKSTAVAADHDERHGTQHVSRVVIGRDTRASGTRIQTTIAKTLSLHGIETVLAGVLPTPAIAFATRNLHATAGIMISASHNPAHDNGIKFFGPDGYKLPDRVEQMIERMVLGACTPQQEQKHGTQRYIHAEGRIKHDESAAERLYMECLIESANIPTLTGLSIALDAAHGAAYCVGKSVLSRLGAHVIAIGTEPDGSNINARCGSMYPDDLASLVKKSGADAGIALDGDADRIIMCDENGRIVDGDRILAIAAVDLKNRGQLAHDTVVGTVMANSGFDIAMQKHGIRTVKAAVGDKYVIESMRKGGYNLGGEQSGHIIFSDYATTGDGLLTALQILAIMKRQQQRLSTLADVMEVYPQVLINVPVNAKPDIYSLPGVAALVHGIEKKLAGHGRMLLRYSGTESKARVMVEAPSESEAKQYARTIVDIIRSSIGAEDKSAASRR